MPENLSRRSLIRKLVAATAVGIIPLPPLRARAEQAANGTTGQERGQLNRLAWTFAKSFSAPALSVAIGRNGQFVHNQTIGMADRKNLQQAVESSLFRIASLSIPITAVTIFTLIEKSQIHLSDKVFGLSGVLGTKYGNPPYQRYVADVTVDHLLTHTAGGWTADSTDPMFRDNSWDQTKLISWTLQNLPLSNPPGSNWAFSNFGYCVLGRIIEQVTGQPYLSYVQANILAPCGISDMAIARNKQGEHAPNEVTYYGQYSEDPYKMNITRMDSAAGWIASPSDLVIFLDHVGGVAGVPSLLKPETIQSMTTPTPAFPQSSPAKYARGWMVRTDAPGTFWHNGSLAGSTSIMVRTSTGMCWAALTNTRTEPHETIDSSMDEMMWNMVRTVPAWGA